MSPDRVSSVPFSWEIKPGVSRASNNIHDDQAWCLQLNLPPCPSKNVSVDHMPTTTLSLRCRFQTKPSRSLNSFRKKQQQDSDPFLAAYINCTASPKGVVRPRLSSSSSSSNSHEAQSSGMKSYMSNLLCKFSCDVMSDNVVSLSHVHIAVTSRERHGARGARGNFK